MEKEKYRRIRMTADKVIKSLQKQNLDINEKEAVGILIILKKIAEIKIKAYLGKHGHGKGKNS